MPSLSRASPRASVARWRRAQEHCQRTPRPCCSSARNCPTSATPWAASSAACHWKLSGIGQWAGRSAAHRRRRLHLHHSVGRRFCLCRHGQDPITGHWLRGAQWHGRNRRRLCGHSCGAVCGPGILGSWLVGAGPVRPRPGLHWPEERLEPIAGLTQMGVGEQL